MKWSRFLNRLYPGIRNEGHHWHFRIFLIRFSDRFLGTDIEHGNVDDGTPFFFYSIDGEPILFNAGSGLTIVCDGKQQTIHHQHEAS
jgi:hypothetical protein